MENKKAQGLIFDIQRYSIHDGPGIRTLIFFKGCPLRCWWCSNPESQKRELELLYSAIKCIGCKKCVELCPKGIIHWEEGKGAVLERDSCNSCGICTAECFAGGWKLVGNLYSLEDLLAVVLRDEIFYHNSGGGVTIGGGEPLFQPEFLKSFLIACRMRGIHTAIETTGYASSELAERIFNLTDLVLMDLKHMDNEKHIQQTGVSNQVILENWRMIMKLKTEVICRVPIIPGFNDTVNEIRDIGAFIKSIGCKVIHILPYHRLGKGKYTSLGRNYLLNDTLPPSDQKMTQLLNVLLSEGLQVQNGG